MINTQRKPPRKSSRPKKRAISRANGPAGHSGIAQELRDAIAKAEAGGVSRAEIAALAGMPRAMIYRVADGKTIPRLDTAERIGKAIGLQLMYVSK